MCDEFMQYLYPILNREFQLGLDQEDQAFNDQFKNCHEYLDEILIPYDLYNAISDEVQQDFLGSHHFDICKIISFIALAKLYDFEVMNTAFTHFAKFHSETFFKLTYQGKCMMNVDYSVFIVYKYCADKATSI